jgi:putative colanic acid biosynthesis glycosyltransferase
MPTSFTIATVCLNNLAGLHATAKTIAAQDFTNFEWIVIDGASTDGTLEWLESQSATYLRWVSAKDKGLYDAMNKGLDLARNDYVIFMNSGDLFASSTTLRVAAEKLSQNPPDILYGDAIEFDDAGEDYKKAMNHRLVYYSMFTHHQSIFYSRAFLGKQRYNLDFRIASDWALTASLLKRGATARYANFPVAKFARGGISNTPSSRERNRIELFKLHEEVFQTGFLGKGLAYLKLSVNAVRQRYPGFYSWLRFRTRN